MSINVAIDELLKLCVKLNHHSQVKISVNDFIIKAAAIAALKVPQTNSAWFGDFTRQFNYVNMNFAV